jgi:hypothetical protein
VLFLRSSSHDVSFGDSDSADRMVGRFAGQFTASGAYPPEGELGRARFAADNGTARASAANNSGEASRGRTVPAAERC